MGLSTRDTCLDVIAWCVSGLCAMNELMGNTRLSSIYLQFLTPQLQKRRACGDTARLTRRRCCPDS